MATRWRLVFPGMFFAWLVLAAPLSAVAPVVHDDAKFFTPDTVKKLNEIAHDIAGKSGRDLLIETFPSVPADQAEKVKGMNREDREKYFRQWGEERVKAAVVNGVYILICKEPAHLEVVVTRGGEGAIDQEARKKLIDQLLTDFREKHFDEGILKAAHSVQDRFAGKKP